MGPLRRTSCVCAVLAPLLFAGCGGSAKQKTASPSVTAPSPATAAAPSPPPSTGGSQSPGALQAEAGSAATGDIPDNQVFLVFHDGTAGYSIKYPEGWARNGSGNSVSFRDKNNIVRIVIGPGAAPTAASVARDLRTLLGAQVRRQPHLMTIGGAPGVKVVYTTESAANAVTGKRVELTVDRYYLGHAGKEAIVDLGTPVGVDNVDAYRLMIESFRWR